MNRLVYRDYTFYDFDIFSGNVLLTNSMVSETLESDTLTFNVTDTKQSNINFLTSEAELFFDAEGLQISVKDDREPINLKEYAYAEPIYYYHDDTLIGKFYVKSILQRAKNKFEIEALSIMGLLINIRHYGGIYNGATTGSVVADIMGDIPYTIDDDVANTLVYGHLPIASKRDNLQQVMFVSGASVLKKNDGEIHFTFNQPYNATIINDDRLYMGGTRNYNPPATSVIVTEHSFYKSETVEETVLYDNSNDIQADYQIITFDNPMHSLRATDVGGLEGGITVHESNSNYAIISGTGILYGKEYVHAKRTLTKRVDIKNVEEKEVSVTDATLVSPLNSNNVLDRVANYYSNADTISYGLVVGEERPGTLILFNDPFGNQQQGYIKEMNINVSSKLKADVEITTNWKPIALGNNFTKSKIVQAEDLVNGVWSVPNDMVGKPALAVLFGGASGGNGGYDGESGGTANFSFYAFYIDKFKNHLSGAPYVAGGKGGKAGEGGKCGKYLTLSIESLASEYAIEIGIGGSGGEPNGGLGQEGTATIFNGVTTDDGVQFVGNYVNLVNGEVYAQNGEDGIEGGDGGGAGGKGKYTDINGGISMPITTEGRGEIGENGETVGEYIGGKGANPVDSEDYNYDADDGDRSWYEAYVFGSGGGGSAFGNNGEDAVEGVTTDGRITTQSKPGNGADAIEPIKPTLGKGGHGGHGGGGAGARGAATRIRYTNYGDERSNTNSNYPTAAIPGKGTKGSQGSDGFILIYY